MKLVRQSSKRWTELRGELLDAQDGNCAICGCPPEKPALDHCHKTGAIRGTLCTSCNARLGWYEKHRHPINNYLAQRFEYKVKPPRRRGDPTRQERMARWFNMWRDNPRYDPASPDYDPDANSQEAQQPL